MKFTKFIAASFAALAMFSCSKELTDVDNGPVLKEGDAQIVVDLGQKTTYSTITNETTIKGGSGRLFKADGSEITMNNPQITSGKFSAIVPAGSFSAAGEAATLYLYVNGTPIDATAGSNAEIKHAAATVATTVDRDLTNGAPAGVTALAVNIKAGIITVPTANLKRAIARVEVRNGSKYYTDNTYKTLVAVQDGLTGVQMPITGYMVSFDKVNLTTGGLMYGGLNNAGSGTVATEKIPSRAIDGVVAGMTNGRETLAYMYPSTGVEATVAVPSGIVGVTPKTVKFDPAANKNYYLTIVPFVSENGIFDYNVVIEEKWDTDVNGGYIDFNAIVLKTFKSANPNLGFNISTDVRNGEISFDQNTSAAFEWGLDELYSEATPGVKVISIFNEVNTYANITTKTTDDKLVQMNIKAGKIEILRNFNYQTYKNYEFKLLGDDNNIYVIRFSVDGENQPKDLSTKINGIEVMNFGPNRNGLKSFDGIVADINTNYSGSTFHDKLVDFISKASTTTMAEIDGKPGAIEILATLCPPGYRVPTKEEALQLVFGDKNYNLTNNSSSPLAFTAGTPRTFGTSTITYTGLASITYGDGYWVVDGKDGNKIVFGNKTSMFTTTPGTAANSKYRVSLWTNSVPSIGMFSGEAVPGNIIDNTRCVKIDKKF